MSPHIQKLGALASAVGALAGNWMESAETHIGFVVLCISGVTAVAVLVNSMLSMCHNVHQRNKDLREERDQLARDKRAAEDLVCEERRKTGICPKVHAERKKL
jgi:heme exporter protein D